MAQQVLDGDGPLGIHQLDFRAMRDGNFPTPKFRQVFFNRVAQQEASLLPQHHRRHGNDGLRHRVDSENAVLRHRRIAGGIAPAIALEVRQPAAPRH